MYDVARRFRRRQQRAVQHHATLRPGQYGMKVVGGLRTRAQLTEIDIQAVRQAKQIDRLIQQMRAQIVPDTATEPGLLAPARAHLRTIAVKVRLKVSDVTELTFIDQRFHRQKIAVPAAVMKYRQQLALLLCQRIQLASL